MVIHPEKILPQTGLGKYLQIIVKLQLVEAKFINGLKRGTVAFVITLEDILFREQMIERLKRDAPKRDRKLWHTLLHLPGNRYLLTGCALLLLSMVLRRALYWRLLGSLCLFIGAVRRAVHMPLKT